MWCQWLAYDGVGKPVLFAFKERAGILAFLHPLRVRKRGEERVATIRAVSSSLKGGWWVWVLKRLWC